MKCHRNAAIFSFKITWQKSSFIHLTEIMLLRMCIFSCHLVAHQKESEIGELSSTPEHHPPSLFKHEYCYSVWHMTHIKVIPHLITGQWWSECASNELRKYFSLPCHDLLSHCQKYNFSPSRNSYLASRDHERSI